MIPPLVESFTQATTSPGCELLMLISPKDHEVYDICSDLDIRKIRVEWHPSRSDYSRKINHGYRESERAWILLGAQDIRFHPGWDIAALECAVATGKRVIGTNDIGNPDSFRRGSFSTHALVARSYADEQGTVDGPGMLVTEVYDHNWVDRELAETAQRRGEWHFCRASVVEHLHPHWGKGVMDYTYKKGLRNYGRDRRLYLDRQPLWGGKPPRPTRPANRRKRKHG